MPKRRVLDSDDSSDEEVEKKKRVISDAESDTTDDDDDWNEDGEQKPKKKKSKPEPTAFSDSDSDTDSVASFNDGYDTDLMGDEEDKEMLDGLPEREREEILFERAERREAMRKRFEIERKIRERAKAEKKERKKEQRLKAAQQDSDSDSDDEKPVNDSRTYNDPAEKRAANSKNERFNALKKLKNEKKRRAEEEQKKKTAESKTLKPSDIFSSGESSDEDGEKKYIDSDSDNESDDDDRRRRSDHSEDESQEDEAAVRRRRKIETKDDLKKAKISRFRMAQWLHMPWFKRTVVGCFVRVNIGAGEQLGKITYRIAEIRDVSESSKIYNLDPGDNASPRSQTNKQVLLRIGKNDRNFRLCFISNNEWSDTEFNYWKKQVEAAGSLPTFGELDDKAKHLDQAKKHVITDQEIEVMVKEKNKHRAAPVNFASKKTTLIKLRDSAETEGNLDQVAEIQNQLDKLEETANRLNRERQKGISGITYINDRIKAALRKKDKVCEEEYRAFRDKKVDPFTRRQTAPILVSNTNIETKAQIKDVLSERYTEDIDMHYESLTFVKENKKAEDKKQQEKVDANDLYNAHDFDIDIDLGDMPGGPTVPNSFSSAPRNPLSGRGLSLQDYKVRNNIMGGHKIFHSQADDGGNQYRWFLKNYDPPKQWPDAVDTTKNINGAKDWFPYGVPWGEDIWCIWGKEGLVKRPNKVTRAQRRAAKLNTYNLSPADHCQEFYMNADKCQRDKGSYYGAAGSRLYGGYQGDCKPYFQAATDCIYNEEKIGLALHERVKRIQANMNIDYMPRGWF